MNGDKKSKIRYERAVKITLYLLIAIFCLLFGFGCENHWIIELTDHMYPELREPIVVLTHIEADYNQAGAVYTFTPRDSLKGDLLVKAFFDDGAFITVDAKDYTLSGTLGVGISAITVNYGGKTTVFDVEVTAAPAAITVFTFASPLAMGVIDEDAKTISVTVPYGTVVTSLTPTVTHTGASYSPEGAQDFTSPVTYTITAADGTTQEYTVTVTVAPANAKAVTAFAFTSPAAAGVIDEDAKTISVTVPYGTSVVNLEPTITHTGASYSPTTAQNFTNPVVYTVTAADGSTQAYTVTVTVALSNAKAITAFAFTSPAAAGVVDEAAKTISVNVPYGTDVTNLTPNITHNGASYSPEGAQDFTSPVTYTVIAADGTTQAYTVTVTVALSNAKAITAFAFTSPAVVGVIDESTKTISVTVPYGTNVTSLTPTVTHTGASYSPITAQNFTSPVTYTVTAADGTTQEYTVTVTVALSNAKAITAFAFTSPAAAGAIDESAKTISVTVPYGTNVTSLTPTVTHTGASYSPITAQNFTSPVTYTVTAADGSTQEYTVTVTVALSNAKAITAFAFPLLSATSDIDESAKTISVNVPYGTSVINLTPDVTHTGASYSPAGAQNFTSPVSYTVTAADGSPQIYVVTVTITEPPPDGSPDNPIVINNANVMQVLQTDIHNNLDKHYRLEADIVLPDGHNWEIIGKADNDFTGTFDGGGFTISNMTISGADLDNQGLFGAVSGLIKNLGLVDVKISVPSLDSYRSTGGIAGVISQNGRLENCFVIGDVEGNYNVGGLVGWNRGTVRNSYFIGNVKGINRIGGLVGSNAESAALVENSYAAGTVHGNNGNAADSGVGGVAGGRSTSTTNTAGGGTVKNSVALNSSVTGNYNVGRVRGSSTNLTITNNYARANMLVNSSPITTGMGTATQQGANVSDASPNGGYHNIAFWRGVFTDFDIHWEWNSTTNLPILRGFEPGTQNPRVIDTIILPDNFNQADLQNAINNAAPGSVIVLPDTGTGMEVDSTITVDKELTITASPGENPIIHRSNNGGFPAFTVGSGGKLTLESNGGTLTIAVSSGTSADISTLISVEAGGELFIHDGVEITNHTGNTTMNHRAIDISGSVIMTGGKIHGIASRGTVRITGGTFTMSGGSITGNMATSSPEGGGVSVYSGGTFIMSGDAEISGNRAAGAVAGTYMGGGGVQVRSGGTFNMEGGTIKNNYVDVGGFGGGVFVQNGGIFSKTGGTIYGNDAGTADWNRVGPSGQGPTGSGHAVYVEGATPKLRTNTAGAGVNLNSGTADGWE